MLRLPGCAALVFLCLPSYWPGQSWVSSLAPLSLLAWCLCWLGLLPSIFRPMSSLGVKASKPPFLVSCLCKHGRHPDLSLHAARIELKGPSSELKGPSSAPHLMGLR